MNAMRLPTILVLAALLATPTWGGDRAEKLLIWESWKVSDVSLAEKGLSTEAFSDPYEVHPTDLTLACNLWEPGNKWGTRTEEHNLMLLFEFKNKSFSGAVRREKDRVQLQLGSGAPSRARMATTGCARSSWTTTRRSAHGLTSLSVLPVI